MEKELGLYLKEARKRRKLTQEEASNIVGVSRSYFSDIETGRYLPSLKLLTKLNDEFHFFYLINNDGKTIQNYHIEQNWNWT